MPEFLPLSLLERPTQIISRGFGGGVGAAAARLARTPCGHPEGWPEVWANLYAELAVAIEARRDGHAVEPGLLAYPTVEDGARGVKFVEAALASDRAGSAWADCTLAP